VAIELGSREAIGHQAAIGVASEPEGLAAPRAELIEDEVGDGAQVRVIVFGGSTEL